MTRVLLIEDDRSVGQPLRSYLEQNGMVVDHCDSLRAASSQLKGMPDVIILDWKMPDGDGVDWLRSQRQAGLRTPVIMLTARVELADRVLGLEMGAEDYVCKPFEPRELLARIRVRLRQSDTPAKVLSSSCIELNIDSREVTFKGKPVELTKTEFNLLRFFLENPRRVLARHDVLEKVWGVKFPSTRTVDVHVMQLRQKTRPELFETVHGVGYRFVPEDDDNHK